MPWFYEIMTDSIYCNVYHILHVYNIICHIQSSFIIVIVEDLKTSFSKKYIFVAQIVQSYEYIITSFSASHVTFSWCYG